MSWHYQVVKTTHEGEDWYSIHENYGEYGYTVDPCRVSGESIESLKWTLNAMLKDIDKHGVIEDESE